MSMDGLDHGFDFTPTSSGPDPVADAWLDLCRRLDLQEQAGAAGGDHDAAAGPPTDAAAIARALAGRPECAGVAAAAFRQVVTAVARDAAPARHATVLAGVLEQLPPDVLHRVVAAVEPAERKPFVTAATAVLPPASVLAVCAAAGAAFNQPLSVPLQALVRKLSGEAQVSEAAARQRADQAFRALVLHLVDSWAAATVDTGAMGFEAMFQQQQRRAQTRMTPEPLRVMQLALESGAVGNAVWGAVAAQTETEAGMRALFDMLKQAPSGPAVAAITGHIATPARLAGLLAEEPLDVGAVDVVVSHMGITAARPLIDALAEAKQRSTRRVLMDRLIALGPDIGPFVAERLDDPRWFVVRNMIALLREAGCPVAGVPVGRFRTHADARVRRETLQLQLDHADTRDQALVEALRDRDRHVLRTALQAARASLPETAVPVLAARLVESDFPPEFRVISLFLLGRSGSFQALDTLLAFVHGGTSLFGRPKLASRSPEMLAALGGLARSFPNDRRVAPLLELARNSKDEQILNALRTTPGRAP
jgi:hypothetical protein